MERVTVEKFCDYIHDEVVPAMESLAVTISGTTYKVDVCVEHLATEKLAAEHGGKLVRKRKDPGARKHNDLIRDALREAGIAVSAKGRLSAAALEKYEELQTSKTPAVSDGVTNATPRSRRKLTSV